MTVPHISQSITNHPIRWLLGLQIVHQNRTESKSRFFVENRIEIDCLAKISYRHSTNRWHHCACAMQHITAHARRLWQLKRRRGRKHDTAAPVPVHMQLEPVGAGCEPVNADEWSDSSRTAWPRVASIETPLCCCKAWASSMSTLYYGSLCKAPLNFALPSHLPRSCMAFWTKV